MSVVSSSRAGGTGATCPAVCGYVAFTVAHEEFLIEILRISEILGMQPITRVPRVPPHIRGVINLRGRIVPVMSLRRMLPMKVDGANETCIVVVQANNVRAGLLVDRVGEIMPVDEDDIEYSPPFMAALDMEFLHGVVRAGDQMKWLLNIERILALE